MYPTVHANISNVSLTINQSDYWKWTYIGKGGLIEKMVQKGKCILKGGGNFK